MKIVVTGGAGYLGSTLVAELLFDGHEVTVIDNFMYGQFPLAHLCRFNSLKIVQGDVRSFVALAATEYHLADVIIPLAAIVGAPACNKVPDSHTVNVDAQTLLMNNLSPSQLVIYPTTNSGYGIGEPGKFCTEETPLRPISVYGHQKVEMEKRWMERENSISLRLATVFGMSPRMRLDLLVNDLVHRALFDRSVVIFEGAAMRNYVHVLDVARAFMHCIKNLVPRGQIYNVGNSSLNMSKLDLCQRIKKYIPFYWTEMGFAADPDKRDYIVSNEKFEATGWHPFCDLDWGIHELIKGYAMFGRRPYSNV